MFKINTQNHYEQKATEEEFLEWYKKENHKEYSKPSLTIDNIIFSMNNEDNLSILLIKRKSHPFKDCWALPGGFVDQKETADEACMRETKEETGVTVSKNNIEQLHTFTTPGRDPRSWVVSIGYISFLQEQVPLSANDDAKEAIWVPIKKTKNKEIVLTIENKDIIINKESKSNILAFDHSQIIQKALERVVETLNYDPKILKVLGETFTLSEIRNLCEQIAPEKSIDSDSTLLHTHRQFIKSTGKTKKTSKKQAREYKMIKSH